MRIIEIVVSPRGETTVQTKGYSGSDCLRPANSWKKLSAPRSPTPRRQSFMPPLKNTKTFAPDASAAAHPYIH